MTDRIKALEDALAGALFAWDEHNERGHAMQGDWVYDARAALAARDAMIDKAETRALDSVTTLHTVIADIRAATVGYRPMLSDLAQALVSWRDEAVAKEREDCARMVDCGCEKGQKAAVIDPKNGADRARACGQYNCGAEDAAAIRKRGEGKGAALDAIENGPFPASWWSEEDGDVLWWCWRDGEWLAEAPYVGSPLCMGYTVELHARDAQHHMHRMHIGGWPGYHTHWTRLPPQPPAPRTFL